MGPLQNKIIARFPYLLGIVPIILILDQISKNWILDNLRKGQSRTVLDGFFHIVHVHNTGAAFGLFSTWKQSSFILTIISVLAILCILVYFFWMQENNRLTLVALSLVVAGAIGNLIDRFRFGYVIDFIDWHYKEVYHWPAFNIADSAITLAMGLLLIELIRDFKRHRLVQREAS